jgi:hypothetical protein
MTGEQTTETGTTGWTVETSHAALQRQIDMNASEARRALNDLRVMLDERYMTQSKATDAAFAATAIALRTALEAAEKAVATALQSAKEAVGKAEIASDKRFESINEFRGQLADMITTLIPRQEVEARFAALGDKLENDTTRLSERFNDAEQRIVQQLRDLTARMDTETGRTSGAMETTTTRRLDTSQLIAALGTLVAILSVAAAVFFSTR